MWSTIVDVLTKKIAENVGVHWCSLAVSLLVSKWLSGSLGNATELPTAGLLQSCLSNDSDIIWSSFFIG